jgi:hypothetical protein
MQAARGNVVGAAGQAAKAAMEESHLRAREQRRWILNEKRLLTAVGLGGVASDFLESPPLVAGLTSWVEAVARALAP